ncbi:hypothetical protein D3C85_733270 [compost metagenome]
MRFRQVQVDGIHHFGQRVRTGDGQHFRVHLHDDVVAGSIFLGAQATGHDHFTVFSQRFADGVERLLHGSVDKTAGIDDHQIGASVGFRRFVAFGAQLGQDLFGVDQRFRAAERDKAHFRRRTWHGQHGLGLGGRNRNTVNFRHSWQLVKW